MDLSQSREPPADNELGDLWQECVRHRVAIHMALNRHSGESRNPGGFGGSSGFPAFAGMTIRACGRSGVGSLKTSTLVRTARIYSDGLESLTGSFSNGNYAMIRCLFPQTE